MGLIKKKVTETLSANFNSLSRGHPSFSKMIFSYSQSVFFYYIYIISFEAIEETVDIQTTKKGKFPCQIVGIIIGQVYNNRTLDLLADTPIVTHLYLSNNVVSRPIRCRNHNIFTSFSKMSFSVDA